MQEKPIWGFLSGLTAAAIWGGMFVVSKAVMDVVPTFLLILSRLLLGILTLGTYVLISKGWKVRPDQFWRIFGVGTVGYGVSLGFQFIGTKISTAANAALVTSATPSFVFIFAAILLSERITKHRLLSLLLATAGVIVVIDPRNIAFSTSFFWGNLCLVAAALTWALYSVLIRRVTGQTDILTTTLIAFIGGIPICLPLSGWELVVFGSGEITLGVIAGILFIGIVSTALAMYLWNYAFVKLDAGTASLTFFVQPVVATILSVIFFKSQITPAFYFGGVLIALALLISSLG